MELKKKKGKAKGLWCSFKVNLFLSDKQITDHKQLPLQLWIVSDRSIYTAVCPKQHSLSLYFCPHCLCVKIIFKKIIGFAESGRQMLAMLTTQIQYVVSEKDTNIENWIYQRQKQKNSATVLHFVLSYGQNYFKFEFDWHTWGEGKSSFV